MSDEPVSPFRVLPSGEPAELYLDLLKRALTNWLYIDSECRPEPREGMAPFLYRLRGRTRRLFGGRPTLYRPRNLGRISRITGDDWPPTAHTMIGVKRLENIQDLAESVLRENIPGDMVETGVWRGGACIFMRGILKAHDVKDRRIWVADSFEGLPYPRPTLYSADLGSRLHEYEELAVSLEQVRANFARYGLLDDQVVFLKGWFHETLPHAPISQLALMRLDGDLYESTIIPLDILYPKLSIGGYVIIDDYGALKTCRLAVDDYRARHHIEEPITRIDATGAFWKKGRQLDDEDSEGS